MEERPGKDKEIIDVEFREIPYHEKVVRNNKKPIGKSRVYKKNIRRSLLFASYILVGTLCYIAGKSNKNDEVPRVTFNTVSESYFDEPVYNGIPYTIRSGETLTGIVYGYQSDANKVEKIIDQIEDYNGINANRLRDGQTIYLFGVPSSKLEEFGYTDNYNYFEPSVEVDMRLSFLKKVVVAIEEVESTIPDRVKAVEEEYKRYKRTYLPGDESALDDIIEELRDLSDEAIQFGFIFDDNRKALPLSEAINYNKEKGIFKQVQ